MERDVMNRVDQKLVNVELQKPYKFQYYHCGKYGHKKINCPDKNSSPKNQNNQNNQDRAKTRYIHCNLIGHPDNIYWDLDKNACYRPDG